MKPDTFSIEAIEKYLFVFNKKLTDDQKAKIVENLKILTNLYLTPFDMILVSHKPSEDSFKIYESPEIYQLGSKEVSEASGIIGYSSGIIARTHINFDPEKGFSIANDFEEIMDAFTNYESLLFIGLTYV